MGTHNLLLRLSGDRFAACYLEIIAIDPDIPLRHQRVQFNSKGAADVAWTIDGGSIGNGLDIGWAPTGGRHKLVLTDLQGNELDSVSFEVRGAFPP